MQWRHCIAHQSLIALGQCRDEFVGVGGCSCGLHFSTRSAQLAKQDVLVDGCGKQCGLLRDKAHLLAQPGQGQVPQVSAIQQHLQVLRVLRQEL